MELLDNAARLGQLVQRQKDAFDASDFVTAQTLAREWSALARDVSTVSRIEGEPAVVSIIVVSHRSNARTLDLLAFLATLTFAFRHEIVIVINGDDRLRGHAFPKEFIIVDCPVNIGASGGRNLGAQMASGAYLLFLDDDGETTQESLLSLYKTIFAHDATIVRGRVRTRPGSPKPPAHYDQGDRLLPSLIDIEGMTICHAGRFADVGGFDPVLFGHEGFELFSRLYKWYGPQSFLYDPDAVLIHDFADDETSRAVKLARYRLNNDYLMFKGVPFASLLTTVKSVQDRPDHLAVFMSCLEHERALAVPQAGDRPLVSILTTARDAESFVADYTESLKRQTEANFEIIFVDDGCSDATVSEMERLWRGDSRLVIAPCAGSGRAAALNTAKSLARGEFCVVADVDDILLPKRIAWSVQWLLKGHDCVGGFIFNEDSIVRGTRPLVDVPTSVRLRCFVGMPVSFPGFAFRKDRFPAPFKDDLTAGIDCEWLYRSLALDPTLDGVVVPYICSYYRLHDGQISTVKRDAQRKVGLDSVMRLHGQFITVDPDKDLQTVLKLMGWQPVDDSNDVRRLYEYAARFTGFDGAGDIRSYLHRTIDMIRTSRVATENAYLLDRLDKTRKKMKRAATAANRNVHTKVDCISPDAAVLIEDEWADLFAKSRTRMGRMIGLGIPPIPFHFVDADYLRMYPDVAEQVQAGRFLSGFHHFILHGRAEGRNRPIRKV